MIVDNASTGIGMKKPILLLAATGYIIRDILLGSFAEHLTRECPLVAAVPDPNDGRLAAHLEGRPIKLVDFPIAVQRFKERWEPILSRHGWIYRFKQAEKQTASLSLQTRLWEGRHTFRHRAAIEMLNATGQILVKLGMMGAIEERYLRSISREPVTQQWRELLNRYQPQAIVSTMLTWSGNRTCSVDLPAVVAARDLGIPVGSLVQSWDNLSSKTAILPSWVDRYWTWSESMSDELLRFNPRVRPESVEVVGNPHCDLHRNAAVLESREVFCARMGLDPSRPYVLFGTGTARWLPREPDSVATIIGALNKQLPQVQSLLRLHPKDDGSRWTAWSEQLKALGVVVQRTHPESHMDRGGFQPPIEFFREQISALYHAAVVVNTASSLTVDAAILDKPVISIGFDVVSDPLFPEGRAAAYNRSTHYGRLADTGGVLVPSSTESCIEGINRYLRNPALDSEGRSRIVLQVVRSADGLAGKRLSDAVLLLLEPSSRSQYREPLCC